MPLDPKDIAQVLGLPFAAALLILGTAWQVWMCDRDAGVRAARWAGPLALAVGFALAFRAPSVAGAIPSLPPVSSTAWLFYAAIGATIVGLLDAIARLPMFVRAPLVALSGGAACMAVLSFKINSDWTIAQALVAFMTFAAVTWFWWISLERALSDGGFEGPLILIALSTALGMTFAMNGNLKYGQLAGSLAAASGAALVLSIWRPRVKLARGGSVVFTIMSICLMAGARYLADESEPGANVYLWLLWGLGALPAFVWLGRWVADLTQVTGRRRTAVRLAVVLLPVAILMTVAAIQFRKSMADEPEYDPFAASSQIPAHAGGSDVQ
jgi:hypothetical protein